MVSYICSTFLIYNRNYFARTYPSSSGTFCNISPSYPFTSGAQEGIIRVLRWTIHSTKYVTQETVEVETKQCSELENTHKERTLAGMTLSFWLQYRIRMWM